MERLLLLSLGALIICKHLCFCEDENPHVRFSPLWKFSASFGAEMCPHSELGFGRVFPYTWDLCQKSMKTWGGTRERMG